MRAPLMLAPLLVAAVYLDPSGAAAQETPDRFAAVPAWRLEIQVTETVESWSGSALRAAVGEAVIRHVPERGDIHVGEAEAVASGDRALGSYDPALFGEFSGGLSPEQSARRVEAAANVVEDLPAEIEAQLQSLPEPARQVLLQDPEFAAKLAEVRARAPEIAASGAPDSMRLAAGAMRQNAAWLWSSGTVDLEVREDNDWGRGRNCERSREIIRFSGPATFVTAGLIIRADEGKFSLGGVFMGDGVERTVYRSGCGSERESGRDGVGFEVSGDLPETGLAWSGTERHSNGDKTFVVHYSIRPATEPPERVIVAIEGPECACLEFDGNVHEELRFTASASSLDGTFEPFQLDGGGPLAPAVVRNRGGDAPELVLAPRPESHAVELRIAYEQDGERYESAPFRVNICTMDSVHFAGGTRDHTFDASSPGRAEMHVHTDAWMNGESVSDRLRWQLEAMAPEVRRDPDQAFGPSVALAYEGLPVSNDVFGPKRITATFQDGPCSCQREQEVRIFFPPNSDNHARRQPPGVHIEPLDAPNWYYYWMQTGAAISNAPVVYKKNIGAVNNPKDDVAARYAFDVDEIWLSDRIIAADGCRPPPPTSYGGTSLSAYGTSRSQGARATGIDCVAEQLRHEDAHRSEFARWWPGGYSRAKALLSGRDMDGDMVPDEIEQFSSNCRWRLDERDRRSCDDRPFADVLDLEIFAYWEGWKWPLGNANRQDWSCGGKQWTGGACPR